MFERFRIKTALRTEMIGLREAGTMPLRSRAEDLFYEPAFAVAPIMRSQGMTSEQAVVFMVTDYLTQAEDAGVLADYARRDPELYDELRTIYRHVLAKAQAASWLRPHIVLGASGTPVAFDHLRE